MNTADELGVVEHGCWFGPAARPLFGWLTRPADRVAVGGVVLAPSIGREARAGRRALRLLATTVAARGYVVLRVDYDGTGDSAGSFDEPGRDAAWTGSVAAAVDLLQASGLGDVAAVGMRLGATIVACAADRFDLGLSRVALWDPCDSGRSYLRELSALEALRRERGRAGLEGAVVTAEHVFPARMAEELRRLDVAATTGKLADRVLVLRRADRPAPRRLEARIAEVGGSWSTTDEQGALLDVDPLFATLPRRAIAELAVWLAEGGGTQACTPDLRCADHATFRVEGGEVTEEVVTLGAGRLFGITTSPPAAAPEASLVVLLNVANEDHTGPSRLWVELARRWATRGLRCVRFDLTGVGDSPGATSVTDAAIYRPEWLSDAVDAARQLTGDHQDDEVFVGLCSGAFWAVEAGSALRSRGVCIVNPPIGLDFLHGVTRLGRSRHAPVRRLAMRLDDVGLHLRWVAVVLWKVLRLAAPSVFSVDMLRRTVDGGSDLLVLASDEDLSPLAGGRLARFFSRRLVAPANYDVTFVPGLDHSLHDPEGRARTVELLDRHVLARFAPTGVAGKEGSAP